MRRLVPFLALLLVTCVVWAVPASAINDAGVTSLAVRPAGDGYWLVDRAARYGSERSVFDRPIGSNQGIQVPMAQAYAQLAASS